MRSIVNWVGGRFLPAALTAAGVTLLGAGLLTYGVPAQATAPSPPAFVSAAPAASPSLLPFPTLPPLPTPGASSGASASPSAARVVTRVVVPALGIDLPVVRPPSDPTAFPYCNVAEEFFTGMSRPGLAGTTYVFAHARTGMFLPLLLQSRIDNGSAMLGMLVEVYTSDDQLFLYEITQVLRHQSAAGFNLLLNQQEEQLALQTSEGPKQGVPGYTGLVLIVLAQPLSSGPADHAAAHPTPQPVVCQ
jgi:hypothetical protein